MAALSELIAALDELLEPSNFPDLGPNGLQVPGAGEVSRVATAVTANRATIERAVASGAQLLLVHHGLFWDFLPTGLSPTLAERLRLLFRHDLALAGYHLPLDAHPRAGNNALLAERLGCVEQQPFGEFSGRPIGRLGRFPGDGIPARDLFARVREATGREPLIFDGGPERVRTIGVISGAGAKALPEAVAAGLDAFLTGEPAEHVMGDSIEAGIHFVAAGHYATETFGVRALGDHLASAFGVSHEFIDIYNPI